MCVLHSNAIIPRYNGVLYLEFVITKQATYIMETHTCFIVKLLFLHLGGGKGSCRFCGTTANTSLLAIGSVCTDLECLERSDVVCDKILPCGHACCGVKGEEKCLPCLHGCAGDDSKLKQDAEDMCMMCYTEGLSYAACIQVS